MTSRLLAPVRSVLGLALCLGLVGVTVALPAPEAEAAAGAEGAFAARINGLRSSKGLPALQYDGQLTGVARAWASRMADAGGISHNPSLSSQVTANWRKLGENVGRGGDVDSLHQAFVNSPGHYANLVDPAFTHLGVGVVERNGVLWTAHTFMALAGAAPPAATPPPRAAPAPRATAPTRRPSPPASSGGAPRSTGQAGAAPAPPPSPPPPPPPPPEPTALPGILIDLRQLDQRS